MVSLPESTNLPLRRRIETSRGKVDSKFLILVLLLSFLGLVMMFSASHVRATFEGYGPTYYVLRQGIVALLGLGVMLIVSRIDPAVWMKLAVPIYGITILLLLGVLVFGVSAGGAKRWIQIAGQQFQPSEVAKFAVICMISAMTANYGERMAKTGYGIVRVGGMVFVILVLVALEKHLSAIMIIAMLSMVMMYVGGIKKRWIFGAISVALVFFVAYVSVMGYAGDRIIAWLHPERYIRDEGYQVIQSQYAIGSGGLFGLGFGMSRQKHLYLPFEYNDYIFAIVCEELGFAGALVIIVLFALLILRGYWIAMHASSPFSTMLALGITTLLAIQVILNISVVCNLLPSTGVGLPFFSYGGTNLLMTFGEVGIVLSISRWSSGTWG